MDSDTQRVFFVKMMANIECVVVFVINYVLKDIIKVI